MGDTRLLCIFAAMLFPPRATRGGTVFASNSILGLLSIGHKIIHVRSPTAHQAFYKTLCLRSPFCLYNVSEESMMSSIFQGKNRFREVGNLLRVTVSRLQNPDLRSYRLQAKATKVWLPLC